MPDPSYADLTTNGLGPGGTPVTTAVPMMDITRLKRMADDSWSQLDDSRVDSEISRSYYDGPGQLTDEMLRALADRRQPEIWINRVRGAVDGVVGVIDSNKVDPRAFPREPNDEQAADVFSDTLRYTAEQNHFNVIKADVLENFLIEGCGAAIIEGAPDADVTITQIRWDTFFYDPRSRRHDFKDARYLGVAQWMYADQVKAMYPKGPIEDGATTDDTSRDWDPMGSASVSMSAGITWQDKPETSGAWIDRTQGRIMVVEIYHVEGGDWYRHVFCAAGILEQGLSAYQDDRGRTRCAIVAGSCYVHDGKSLSRNQVKAVQNARYGIVRDMRPIQDEINMRRQKLLHEANVRQVQNTDPDAPPVSEDTVREEAARPDGVLPRGWAIVDRRAVSEIQMQLLQEGKVEIERMGPNPAILGRQEAGASGRADQIRQAAGMTELQRVLGRFADWELRVYKAAGACQRQFWKAPKWIRITGDEMAAKYVEVNVIEVPGVQATDPQTGQPATDQQGNPVWQTPPVIKNEIAKMDVDIVIDTVPDTASLQQEVWQELIGLIGRNPSYAQQVPFKVAIEMSPLPRKKQLLDLLETAQQENAPQMQAIEQAKADRAMAEQFKIEMQGALAAAQAQLARITGITNAATAHIGITQAEMLEDQATAGVKGVPGYTPTHSDQGLPPPPIQGQADQGAQPA